MAQQLRAVAGSAGGSVMQQLQQRRRVWHKTRGSLARPAKHLAVCSSAAGDSSSAGGSKGNDTSSTASQWPDRVLFFASGNAVSLSSRRRTELWPEHHFSREDALQQQLTALQQNNAPYVDHGVEVMYRFANFDPFNPRTLYFGRSMDLGQFERFRRIMHTPPYATLLGYTSAQLLSTLEVSEHTWVARVEVTGAPYGEAGSEVAVYEFTMVQRVGGVHDGYWFTQSLVADGNDWVFMRGPIPGQAV